MAESKVGRNTSLVGFDVLEPLELDGVWRIIDNYIGLISERADYRALKLSLNMHPKGKSTLYEIKAQIQVGDSMLRSERTDWDLLKNLGKIMEKILTEARRSKTTGREEGRAMIREQEKIKRKVQRK